MTGYSEEDWKRDQRQRTNNPPPNWQHTPIGHKLKLKCPLCHTHLSKVDTANYQTLAEHVSRPNDEPSRKDGYGCTFEPCNAFKHGLRWLDDGEGPYISKKMGLHDMKNTLTIGPALGSWWREHWEHEQERKREQ